jgi:hypothetical protein
VTGTAIATQFYFSLVTQVLSGIILYLLCMWGRLYNAVNMSK